MIIPETFYQVEGNLGCSIKCSHFDAFRFFHPSAQPLNSVKDLSRQEQDLKEQPGCIHANMDLFKFAYMLYPFLSADLLEEALRIAVAARRVDMRGSPYDVKKYLEPEENVLAVETSQGRREYAVEQEKVYAKAVKTRVKLIEAYEKLTLFQL